MSQSPTVRRIQLGAELKQLREATGQRREDAAKVLECDVSKIGKIERGERGIRPKELRELLEFYGASPDKADALAELARDARQRGWWVNYRDAVNTWFEDFVGLETEAAEIRSYQTELVPGVLQTEAYARAVIQTSRFDLTEEQARLRVQVRLERQGIFNRDEPPHMLFVLNEAVLRRSVGTPDVMLEQMNHLIEVSQRPRVTLQIVPFSAGAYAGMGTSFVLFRFRREPVADVVYLEHQTGALYLDGPAHVQSYDLLFARLQASALAPAASRTILIETARKL